MGLAPPIGRRLSYICRKKFAVSWICEKLIDDPFTRFERDSGVSVSANQWSEGVLVQVCGEFIEDI